MISKLPYKTKQFFFVLIKLSIVFAAFYFIYAKLTTNNKLDFNSFVSFLNEKQVFALTNCSLLILLSIFNWLFEIVKWKTLVTPLKKIKFLDALAQSLGALTASLFTPNRIGEYGAKAICFEPKHRKRIVLLNFIGNIMQMTITVLLGVIGLFFLTKQFAITINFLKLSILLLVLILFMLLAAFVLKFNKYKIKGFTIKKIKLFINELPFKTKIVSWCLSLLRYLIFSFQFYFLLSLFKSNLSYIEGMLFISTFYLLSSILPSIFIFDVVIKGSIGVYLFSFINVNELTILAIITLMWFLNFVIPSLFGSIYVLNFNWPQNEN